MRRGPGRPPGIPRAMRIETRFTYGQPVATVAGQNHDVPLAPIFAPLSQQPPNPDDAQGSPSATEDACPAASPCSLVNEDLVRPRPDPSRVVESDNEDDDEDALSDDPDEDNSSDSAPPRRRILSFVMTAFDEHRTAICKHTQLRGPLSSRTSYYDTLQSFWLPLKHAFFSLNKVQLSPHTMLVPRFFYWDPDLLVDSITCPREGCMGKLMRHGLLEYPRRIVDLEGSFYMIGARYQCPNCSKTFVSWDSELMSKLPDALVASFPAWLSHRSGISDQLFAFMRCCFQNGMGAKQFSDSLNTIYRHRHDQLEIQYLQMIIARTERTSENAQYPPFPSFEGSCSHAPSAQYCRDAYDKLIEEIESMLDQHMAQLSCRGLAMDHSHKVTKHIAKVAGEAVFIGLLTMTNEFGEIRICDLVPSKAHSQFDIALRRLLDSAKTFGMEPPQLVFTDNIADKPMLEQHFPSLLTGVKPVSLDGLLPLEIPADVDVRVCRTTAQVNTAILGLVEQLEDGSAESMLTVGLDTEWNVDLDSRRRGVPERKQTAVMQLAHHNSIFIILLTEFLESNSIPPQLSTFLANPQVLKVGKNIAQDLQFLEEDFKSKQKFVGACDIGQLAKDKNMVETARVGLAELCKKALSCTLQKDQAIQVSNFWSGDLSPQQLRYAALDVWASLKVYEALVVIEVPVPLDFTQPLPPHLPVYLYHSDRTSIIARGVISEHAAGNSSEGINITPTRTVVRVDEVYVPGAVINVHRKQALRDFQDTCGK
ncbi:hypothetical protein DFP72DRAFT_1116992 [Ephemerocybe angulata]|uniref:3'-5' exonuclease n=1 Tax=Ephemerocybe angulata TaxID=980116 RepID=A0A8H6LRS3_9AGAR|nr:hypothetical protein DFP72DRAFT_1116992 [Tulosesus angulatus]